MLMGATPPTAPFVFKADARWTPSTFQLKCLSAVGAYSGTGNVMGSLLGRAVATAVIEGRSEVVEAFR